METQNATKILILGANGMLGHKLMQVLSPQFPVTGTVRGSASGLSLHPVFAGMNMLGGVSADDPGSVRHAIDVTEPGVIINCIGIVKQLPAAADPLRSIAINALFPHQLAAVCREKQIRLLHVSTDCVFSGRRGMYTEEDASDAEDLYGKTKYLGEVGTPGCLTLRTSIIGRELETRHGLLEWFLAQEGKTVPGYRNAIFSGLTTLALSGIIGRIIAEHPRLHGIRQVASEPIAKFDLLTLIKNTYGLRVTIEPDESVRSDRSLNAEKFQAETGIAIPSWEQMIDGMYRDPTPYNQMREHHVHG